MAKTAQDTNVQKLKTPKAKKRQHAIDQEEEIAMKTFVVETPADASDAVAQQQATGTHAVEASKGDNVDAMDVGIGKKPKKRKSRIEKCAIKEKRRRTSQTDEDEDENELEEDADVAMEHDMPTANELRAAEHIQEATAKETIRQKKKKKHEQRVVEQKTNNADKEKQRNEEYLQKWKYKQAEWKFEKLRQISIQQNVFDDTKITAELWPIALEYLSGSKGAAKKTIFELANEVINALDRECNEKTEDDRLGRQQIVNSTKYQRARDLLQNLD